jgi:NADPH2:quinone reductase
MPAREEARGVPMKALLCKAFCPPEGLVLEDVPALEPGPGQAVIAVKACGVNFFDGLVIQGKYQIKPPMPFAPGGEVSGVVRAVGEGVTSLTPGTRVLASTGHGGFAEEVLVDAVRAVPIPDSMDFVTAAGFLITYATSHHALINCGQLRAGQSLLVLGAAGGVGLTAVEIGKVLGARVIAAASSDEKLALAREHGADETINYAKDDLRDRIKALTGGAGVDMVYDPVGGDYAEPAIRSLAWRGKHLVIGFAAGAIPKIPLNLMLLKESSVVGVFWGAFAQRDPDGNAAIIRELLAWHADGKIKPHVSATFPLARGGDAIKEVVDRRALGKIVVVMDAP